VKQVVEVQGGLGADFSLRGRRSWRPGWPWQMDREALGGPWIQDQEGLGVLEASCLREEKSLLKEMRRMV